MRKLLLALVFLSGCVFDSTGPTLLDLRAWYRVEQADSAKTVVFFQASAPDSLWWKLVWMDFNWPDSYLFDYGRGVGSVEVAVIHGNTFEFWMDFWVWNQTDTTVITYMSKGGA